MAGVLRIELRYVGSKPTALAIELYPYFILLSYSSMMPTQPLRTVGRSSYRILVLFYDHGRITTTASFGLLPT